MIFDGAGGRGRTDMTLRSRDFESRASTNFTTPARLNVLLLYSFFCGSSKKFRVRLPAYALSSRA